MQKLRSVAWFSVSLCKGVSVDSTGKVPMSKEVSEEWTDFVKPFTGIRNIRSWGNAEVLSAMPVAFSERAIRSFGFVSKFGSLSDPGRKSDKGRPDKRRDKKRPPTAMFPCSAPVRHRMRQSSTVNP